MSSTRWKVPARLADLFDGRSQLLVQHFMFAPGWEQGCKSCSYMADHNDGANIHLAQRDVTLVAVSRAPLADIERFRQRMGWQFEWVSSHGTDFNHDFGVNFTQDEMSSGKVDYNYVLQPFPHEEAPGISVFYRDDAGEVFHTYSRYGRGVEVMMHTYNLLELTPKGRDEDDLDYPMAWVRHHDRYETQAPAKSATAACCVRRREPAAPIGNSCGNILAMAGGRRARRTAWAEPANGWMFAAAWGMRARGRARCERHGLRDVPCYPSRSDMPHRSLLWFALSRRASWWIARGPGLAGALLSAWRRRWLRGCPAAHGRHPVARIHVARTPATPARRSGPAGWPPPTAPV